MPPVQPGASVVGTGLGIRYIGNWAYALSGAVNSPFNTEATMLEFTSGTGIFVANFEFGINDSTMDSATEIVVKGYFNGEVGFYRRDEIQGGTGVTKSATMVIPATLLIPPLTEFKLTSRQTDGDTQIVYAMLSGRVYGAEE